MQLKTRNININLDNESGLIRKIVAVDDSTDMNWVLENSEWGKLEGFENKSIEIFDDRIFIHMAKKIEKLEALMEPGKLPELEAFIERKISGDFFEDSYYIKNVGPDDFFITQDTFGIHFPFQCLNKKEDDDEKKVYRACNAHIWCGDNICWMYGVKLNGIGPFLLINMSEGAISDYSIKKDISRTPEGSHYRGKIILNPSRCVLRPGEMKTYTFVYKFTNVHPKEILKNEKGFLGVTANLYTPSLGQKVSLTAEYYGTEIPQIFLNGEKIKTIECGDFVKWDYIGNTVGERKFDVYVGDKHTFIKINVIDPIEIIMDKRAHFIAEKQQYIDEGSRIDGAYLIYDNVEQTTYCDNRFVDNGASRERIGMGLLVARQLQKNMDERLLESLKRHYQFVYRELFDEKTSTVFNRVGKDNSYHRIYNYPWFSLYFLEWFKIDQDISHLIEAAKTLIKYYELDGAYQDSQCIEAVELIETLNNAGLTEFAEKVKELFLSHANSIIKRGMFSKTDESGVMVHEVPNTKACYLAQAYILTKKEKYLKEMKKYITISEGFFSFQPDYHLNEISLRHTDGFWFGRRKQYGDLYPHYWSCLTGWMYYWCEKAMNCKSGRYENILRNNLCVYSSNGAAANSYLFPYKIKLFSSIPDYECLTQPMGEYTGKRYDEWSNDQDFALYYADKLLNSNYISNMSDERCEK